MKPFDIQKVEKLKSNLEAARDSFLGYPVSKDFDYSQLNEFLEFPVNNLGYPFEDVTYKVQTHEMEKEVVGFFAKLFRAAPSDYWGMLQMEGLKVIYKVYI
jgi:histidine decarboxylase